MNSLNRDGEKKIRLLLNDFFQDIDTEARIGSELANRIVDVHLVKFLTLLEEVRAEEKERVCSTKVIEPSKDVERLSDKSQAFLAGQISMLTRIKFPKQAVSAITNQDNL